MEDPMELEIKDYLRMIKKRLRLIMGVVLMTTVFTGIFSYYYMKPIYEANAKLIVTKAQDLLGAQVIDYGSIDASIKLINTYKEIIKTPIIMDKVVKKYPDLGIKTDELIAKVNVNSTNESQVMTISLQDSSYERAARIVNATAEIFQSQIPLIMKIDNVTILNEANAMNKPAPVKPNPMINTLISFILSIMIALCLVITLEYLDDTLKTEKDIMMYLDIPTLGVIVKIQLKDMISGPKSSHKHKQGGDPAHISLSK
jgi:capsular polysaccharide biosynthesis protein